MIRTQVQLTEEQVARLRRRAADRGVSMATLIREAVDLALSEDDGGARRARARAVVGAFRSGRRDVSEQHDLHLAEAFAE